MAGERTLAEGAQQQEEGTSGFRSLAGMLKKKFEPAPTKSWQEKLVEEKQKYEKVKDHVTKRGLSTREGILASIHLLIPKNKDDENSARLIEETEIFVTREKEKIGKIRISQSEPAEKTSLLAKGRVSSEHYRATDEVKSAKSTDKALEKSRDAARAMVDSAYSINSTPPLSKVEKECGRLEGQSSQFAKAKKPAPALTWAQRWCCCFPCVPKPSPETIAAEASKKMRKT